MGILKSNTIVDEVNDDKNDDTIDSSTTEWHELTTVLNNEESVDPQLYYKAFILSLHIKYKWLISVKHILYNNNFYVLYKCCTCQTELFLSNHNIIGKSFISHKFQNEQQSKSAITKTEYFSKIFDILLNPRSLVKLHCMRYNWMQSETIKRKLKQNTQIQKNRN